mgnify:CR=1 FL=1
MALLAGTYNEMDNEEASQPVIHIALPRGKREPDYV